MRYDVQSGWGPNADADSKLGTNKQIEEEQDHQLIAVKEMRKRPKQSWDKRKLTLITQHSAESRQLTTMALLQVAIFSPV